jgi:A/G-specific adenine glycosylase
MNNLLTKHALKQSSQKQIFQKNLLDWYDLQKRELPWRTNPSLYKTVVSEFMLQQTRVSTVLPYFKNWIKKFPDFKTLALASEEEVLKAWEGLGYYSRARNIHKLASIAVTWETPPKTLKAWMGLPGVGPYIAAAVTSIAFLEKNAVCDGNLVRVLSRIFAIDEEYKDGSTAQKKLQPHAQSLINEARPGDYNQAMMELGATVCHRKSPLCLTCPVLNFCKAGTISESEKFPNIKKKKQKKKSIQRYWVESESTLLLYTDLNSKTKLSGIYELPPKLPASMNYASEEKESLGIRKRTIGNVDYEEEIIRIHQFTMEDRKIDREYIWAEKDKMHELTLSGPHRKWIEEIF